MPAMKLYLGENTAQAAAYAREAKALRDEMIAGEVVRSANTQVLIDAVRNNAFFPQPSYRCAANDLATITVPSGGAASTINANNSSTANVSMTNTAKLTWLGGAAKTDVNGAYYPRGAWYAGNRTWAYVAFEFEHTGTQFEVTTSCGVLQAGTNFRVLVNDRIAGEASIPIDGAWRQIKVVFPTSATRRVRIESCGGAYKGLNVAATSEVTASPKSYPLVTLVGDSFPEGTGATKWDGEGESLLRACGFKGANASVGGTGILNPGTGGRVNWQDAERLSDLALNGYTDAITGAAPDVKMGIIQMSINDNVGSGLWGGAASLQEAVNKGLWTLIDHWQVHRSGKPLVVFGPTYAGSTSIPLELFKMRDAGQEACGGAMQSNVWFIDRLMPLPLLRSGSSTTSTDQAYLYTIGGGDPTHPSPAGHNLDALWASRELRRLILTEFA